MKKILMAITITFLASQPVFGRGWVFPNKPISYIEANDRYIQFVVNGQTYFYLKSSDPTLQSPSYSDETRKTLLSLALTSFTAGKNVNILHDDKKLPGTNWIIVELISIGTQI